MNTNDLNLTHRPATPDDIPLLADWNHQLIHDENHRNNMTIPELTQRMTTFPANRIRAPPQFSN